jgi:hypothetical protein
MSDITRAQLGKANRALKKLGNATPTEEEKEKMVLLFLSLGIDPALKSSSFLAKKFRLRQTPPPSASLVPSTVTPSSSPPAPALSLKAKTKTLDETAKTRGKVVRGLRKAGYPEASELLIAEALNFLTGKGINPLAHASKTLANRLRAFKPAIVTVPKPAASKKSAELMILAAAMALEIPASFTTLETDETEKLETLIRKAARTLVEPSNSYARDVALRHNIVFEGTLVDCFGYWERNNYYCERCSFRDSCFTKVKEASLGALALPAMREFLIPPDFERESLPLRVLSVDKTSTEGALAALADRNMLLSWLEIEFPTLVRVDYSESTNFQISNLYRKRLVLLKIERFSTRAYSVIFSAASPEQATEFKLVKTRHGYQFTEPDVMRLQEHIRAYLAVSLDVPAVSLVLSKEEEVKQRIQKELTLHWTGRIEHRSGYDLFVDMRGLKILKFNRSSKGFQLDFSRWGEKKAEEHGLRHTASGARYEGDSEEELGRLLSVYLHSLKSKYFALRHPGSSGEYLPGQASAKG